MSHYPYELFVKEQGKLELFKESWDLKTLTEYAKEVHKGEVWYITIKHHDAKHIRASYKD